MISKLLATITLLGLTNALVAEKLSVSLANWDAMTLDVDGDGEADFEGSLSNNQNIAFITRFDTSLATHQFPGLLPGQGAGGSSNQFASLDDLRSNDIYSGDVAPVTPLFGDLHLGTTVAVLNANKAKPIWAGWRFGTKGEGNDPFQVIGFILDTSAFFASGGTAPIELYTHEYGSVALGETLSGLSLASTLGEAAPAVPTPPVDETPQEPFAPSATFSGPAQGTFSFSSTVGKVYHLKRSLDLVESIIEQTKPGTGETLTLEFNDSANPATQAFFWVEEAAAP